MAKDDPIDQANAGAPAADIPDLKKKEKERKKAGASWGGAKPGGAPFSGATGGTVARAAASAAGASGGAAIAPAGSFSATVGRLASTLLGKFMIAGGVTAFLGGATMFGYGLFKGGPDGGTGSIGSNLGALASSLKIRPEGNGDRTAYMASKGEIVFDPVKKAAPADAAKNTDEKPAEAAPDQAGDPYAGQNADLGARPDLAQGKLAHNLSGAKLTSNLGGNFGGKNIFTANNGVAPKLNDSIGRVNIPGARNGGQLTAIRSSRTGRVSQGIAAKRLGSNRALGQLKVAKGMSLLGAQAQGTESAALARAAFDGASDSDSKKVEDDPDSTGSPNGTTGGGPGGGPGSGPGAPDMTSPNVDDPTAVPITMDPYNTAGMIGAIAALAKQAGQMKKNGMLLMAVGAVLVGIGAALLGNPFTAAIGAALIGVGSMLIGMGVAMMMMAAQMKAMADTMSQALSQATGDIKQDEINKYCIQQAYQNGTDPKACDPPQSIFDDPEFINREQDGAKRLQDQNERDGEVVETCAQQKTRKRAF
ncbi:MAG: hypothetical protein HYZ74_01560 [Elusimicrobia bacterium]|nr:hypothetical protein [Elusimicrobiota bacterium]